jgi:cell division protein FtsZ
MIEFNEADIGEIPADAAQGVKVIGVGGAGANVLDRMALEGSDDARLLTLNTDVRALTTSVSSDKIQLGATLLKGMGTGGDPSLGRQAALEAVDEIREAVRGNGMLFLCVGLGGGTGSGAAPEVCRIAREEGVFLVVFATMPFSFEGERRMTQATDALETIGRYANAVISFDNDRMGELIVPKDGVTQAFAAADKIISQSIRATMNVVFRPGIIRIGMDDLLSALDTEDSRCLFGYGLAKGDNRSLEAVEQALKCPLLDRGKLLNEARAVLVQVAGGDTMTLYEVQLVMEEVTKHVGSGTQILFGTGTDKRLSNSLSVTIISSIPGPYSGKRGEIEEAEEDAAPAVSLGAAPAVAASVSAAPVIPEAPVSLLAQSMDAAEEASPQAVEDAPEPPALEIPELESSLEEEEDVVDSSAAESAEEDDSGVFEPILEEPEEERPAYSPDTLPISPVLPEAAEDEDDFRNPIAQAVKDASGEEEEASGSDVDHVEAVTDSSQKITLTRMVSSGNTGRIKTRAPEEGSDASGPVLPPTKAPSLPPEEVEPSEEAKQQQEMLQLEPTSGKGRFAKTDPTIVDGEDLDVPTFLRKK